MKKTRHTPFLMAALLASGMMLANSARATDFNQASGDWNTAGNWTPSGVPGSADDAEVGGNTQNPAEATIGSGASGTTDDLFIGGDNNTTGTVTLAANATLDVANRLFVGGSGTPNRNGTLVIGDNAAVTVTLDAYFGHAESYGAYSFGSGATLTIDRDLYLDNGTFTLNTNNIILDRHLYIGDENDAINDTTVTLMSDFTVINPNGDLFIGQGKNNVATLDLNGFTYTAPDHVYLGQGNNADSSVGNLAFTSGGFMSIGNDFYFSNATNTFTDSQISIGRDVYVGGNNYEENDAELTLDGTFTGIQDIFIADGRENTSTLRIIGSVTVDGSALGIANDENTADDETGTLILGDTTTSGTVDATSAGGFDVKLRETDGNTGTIRGWGAIQQDTSNDNDDFFANGRIIADGDPDGSSPTADRTLDIDTGDMVGDTLATTQGDGTKVGWYAEDRGKLVLDTLTSVNGDITWGDDDTNTSPDLVNSIYFDFGTVSSAGDLDVALLAEDHSEITASPNSVNQAIGYFSVDFDGTFDTADITFKYDAAAASDENELKVFERSGTTGWAEIGFSLDTANDTIAATNRTNLGTPNTIYFAIAELGEDPPAEVSLTPSTVNDHSPIGTLAGTMTMLFTNNPSGFNYTLDTQGAHASFDISSTNLLTDASLVAGDYDIWIIGAKGGYSITNGFTITVTAGLAGVDITTQSFDDYDAPGTLAGTMTMTNVADTTGFSYSLDTVDDYQSFDISGTNLLTDAYLAAGTYDVSIIGTRDGFSRTNSATITVAATGIAVDFTPTTVDDTDPPNTLAGTLTMSSVADASGFSYSLESVDDYQDFDITGTNLYTDSFLAAGTYNLSIIGTEGSFSRTNSFTVTVDSIGDDTYLAPVVAAEVEATATAGDVVGNFEAQATHGSTITYSTTGGRTDLFEVTDSTNLTVAAGAALGNVGTIHYLNVNIANNQNDVDMVIKIDVVDEADNSSGGTLFRFR